MTIYIITLVTLALIAILIGTIIWLRNTPKKNHSYFKIGSALVAIVFIWLSGEESKLYVSIFLTGFIFYIIRNEFLSLRKNNAKV
ncbi:MAG TPA: hypothetical protein VFZ33_00790 [Chitinophagaceae bacterium]